MRSVTVRCGVVLGAILAAALFAAAPARADSLLGIPIGDDFRAPMTFSFEDRLFGGPAIWAVGDIEGSSGADFGHFLAAHAAAIRPGMEVILHSRGGDPEQGMAIGRLIRAHSLDTMVAQRSTKPGELSGVVEPGLCASACSLAFLGGVARSMPDGSVYGVHDASLTGSVPNAYAEGQSDAAAEAAYMTAMGVTPELAVLKNRYDSSQNELLVMTAAQMAAFNVTTREVQTSWNVEQVDDAFMLIGANPTRLPGQFDQLMFWCDRKPVPRVLLGTSYVPADRHDNAPQTRAGFVKTIQGYRLERTGATPIDIEPGELHQPPMLTGAVHVTTYFDLTPRILAFLMAADEVRFEFVVSGSFFDPENFDSDVASGREQITRFLAACR